MASSSSRGVATVATIGGTSRSSFRVHVSTVLLMVPEVWEHEGGMEMDSLDRCSASANVNSFSMEELMLESVAVDDVIGVLSEVEVVVVHCETVEVVRWDETESASMVGH